MVCGTLRVAFPQHLWPMAAAGVCMPNPRMRAPPLAAVQGQGPHQDVLGGALDGAAGKYQPVRQPHRRVAIETRGLRVRGTQTAQGRHVVHQHGWGTGWHVQGVPLAVRVGRTLQAVCKVGNLLVAALLPCCPPVRPQALTSTVPRSCLP